MFTKMKNIETAFQYVRNFSLTVVISCVGICCFALYKSFNTVHLMQDKVYVLANGKVLEAFASDRKENIPVEAKDHVKSFHTYFFSLDPDDKVIKEHVTKALYLADESAKRVYDDLKENGYYAGIISGNISQEISIDSIKISTDSYPFGFLCYAKQQIVRTTSVMHRNLITRGTLRTVSRSDNNPHGFLIEKWETIENKDLYVDKRK